MKLEYYKLQKTFAGAIELEHAKGVYEPVTQKGALGHDPKEPLDETERLMNTIKLDKDDYHLLRYYNMMVINRPASLFLQ